MTLSNKLTISRVMAIPIALMFVLHGSVWSFTTGYILSFLIGFTDFLDGYIARKMKEITKLGQFMDPIADKIFFASFSLYLIQINLFPIWLFILIIVREVLATNLRIFGIQNKTVIEVSSLGKLKTFSQFLLLLYLGFIHLLELMNKIQNPYPLMIHFFLVIFIFLATFLTIISIADYIWKNRHLFISSSS